MADKLKALIEARDTFQSAMTSYGRYVEVEVCATVVTRLEDDGDRYAYHIRLTETQTKELGA